MKKLKNDLISGIVLTIFGILIYVGTPILVKTKKLGDVSGARMFPQFLGIALTGVSFVFVVVTLYNIMQLKKEGVVEEKQTTPLLQKIKGEWKVVVLMGVMLAYLYLFTHIGFLVSSLILATVVLFLLGERKVWKYLVLYAVVVLIYLGFTKILMVRLP